MKVLKIDDTDMDKKGYATMECEFTEEEIHFFIEYAVNDIIRKGMEYENNLRTPVSDSE